MKVSLLADVGGHVRDAASELRAVAAVRELRRRGAEVVVLGREGDAGALPRADVLAPGIQGDAAGRRHVEAVARFAAGDEAAVGRDDPVRALRTHLAGVDALYVAGGDLSSARPWLLYERAAAVLVAAALRKRIVLGGQTLGPRVDRADAPVLRRLLDAADLVTVADPGSLETWRALGLPGRPVLAHDDLTVLVTETDSGGRGAGAGGPVLATLSPDPRHVPRSAAVRAYARLLDALAERFRTGVLLVPPAVADASVEVDVDLAFSRQVALALSSPAEVRAWRSTAGLIPDAARAAAVVTTHPHAAAAAVASGTPLITVALGHAEAVHLDGLLAGWDAAPSVSFAELAEGSGLARLAGRPPAPTPPPTRRVVGEVAAGWDVVRAALAGASAGTAPVVRPVATPTPAPAGAAEAAAATGTRVVVVTRTKDRPLLLARALDDVLGQSFPAWHQVVVNDGGDPAVVDALVATRADAYAGRITVVHHADPVGMEAASNAGVARRDSEFLVLHDDDDTWHPDFLARTVAHLDAHPGEVGVVVRTEVVYEWIEEGRILEEERHIHWPAVHEAALPDYLTANRAVPIALLYRRSLHARVGPYDESLPVVGDWDFHLRILKEHRLGFLDGEPLAFWRKRRDPAGADGNSMEAHRGAHLHHDVLIRDAHLRAWVADQGLGLPLYLARLAGQEAAALGERLDDLERRLDDITRLLRDQADRPDPLTRVVRRVRAAVAPGRRRAP